MRSPLFVLLTMVTVMFLPSPGWTAQFDFIYTDSIDVTLCIGCGITLAGLDFGLLVNTSDNPISDSEFNSAVFTAVSSVPGISLDPFINDPGAPIGPILPGEAVGSVTEGNEVLLTRLLPGETHRNTFPRQVIAFMIDRDSTLFEGEVRFDVTLEMLDEVATFRIIANLSLGPHDISFRSADRVSSQVIPTTTASMSWGQLKAAFR